MLTIEQLHTMLALQDKLNSKINPNWLPSRYPWHRAIMVEAVEALEHYGWKWWKKQTPDLPQARIELVDIWHFVLSKELERMHGDYATAAQVMHSVHAELPFGMDGLSVADKLGALIAAAGGTGRYNANAFVSLMQDFELSWQDLYTTYIAKNVLNMFRQDHGYKEGSYVKMWDKLEDNVVLDTLMKLKPDATPEQLYAKLESTYAKLFTAA